MSEDTEVQTEEQHEAQADSTETTLNVQDGVFAAGE